MVSKAFQVLSGLFSSTLYLLDICSLDIAVDPQKRTIYDQSGSDPEDRTASRSGFSSAGFGGGGGGGFEGEMSPEDLFNMFFGGGGNFGGGGFGGGGPGTLNSPDMRSYLNQYYAVFTTTFGSGGFRTARFGGGARPQQQQGNQPPRSAFIQLLPLIILFAFSMISALPSLFTTPPVPDPHFAFTPTTRYFMERHTTARDIVYHINPTEFMNHPVIGPELVREGVDLKVEYQKSVKNDNKEGEKEKAKAKAKVKRGPNMAKLEDTIERTYISDVWNQCRRAQDRKERAKEAEVGLFGIGTDWEKVRRIDSEVIESCVELDRLGVGRNHI